MKGVWDSDELVATRVLKNYKGYIADFQTFKKIKTSPLKHKVKH